MYSVARSANSHVIFVAMPWGSIAQPSLALGLLKAQLATRGISADVANLNLLFAEFVGRDSYEAAKNRNVMASEWVFAEDLGNQRPSEDYITYLQERGAPVSETQLWKHFREICSAYLNRCVE